MRTLSLVIVLLVVAATPATSAQPDEAPCGTDGPLADVASGDGFLRIRLNVTHDDVVGWLCVYYGDRTLQSVWPGPYQGPGEYTYEFIDFEPGLFTAEFHIEGGILRGTAADEIDLSDCVRNRGEIVLNLTYQAPTLVSPSSDARCILGNATAEDSGPVAFGDGGPDDGDGSATTRLVGSSWTPVEREAVAVGLSLTALASFLVAVRYWGAIDLALAGLFGRRLTGDAADHPVRQRILHIVEAEPGLHANAIANRLELAQGQTAHHLRMLVRHGDLDSSKVHGRRRYFAGGRFGSREKHALAILRRRNARKVYRRVDEDPSRSLSAIAQEVGVAPSTVSKIVKQLRRAELVEGDALRSTLRTRPLPPSVRSALAASDD